ncbi:Pyridine nucleotide-disulfide oxidoreductase [Phytophthora megakarya]|uniref:Pyridine nucleotide-disulfide oxidoreductase n=1 Tax=Phytophthora megakarya TaxID=4795 RepID=A0A225VSS8_9STRA|nr:Pyridine nucleotide-disulfide oxidoreductase [Phytophthora megakarya]
MDPESHFTLCILVLQCCPGATSEGGVPTGTVLYILQDERYSGVVMFISRYALDQTAALWKEAVKIVVTKAPFDQCTGVCRGGFRDAWPVEKRTLRTDLGTEIESDAQLVCGESSPMTEHIPKMEACLVTTEGFIKLQLDSDQCANIHALDIASNNPAPKRTYYFGSSHAQLTLLEKRLGSLASYNRQTCGNWVKR